MDREATHDDGAVRDVDHLDERLAEPTAGVVEVLGRLPGDIVVLGASGKMGPTLAWMARRASDEAGVARRVFGVARFSDPSRAAWLRDRGVEPVRCDLLDPDRLDDLPDAPNVVHMAAFKFGAAENQPLAWAVNCFLPGLICRRYRRSRIVAFSTGNVYGTTPVESGGSREADPPAPVGEYAMSCLGRERVLESQSRALGIPMAVIRLNYATELRYGVLVDIGRKVRDGEPIDLTMGYLNAIWQGDANAMALRAFAHADSPPTILNVTGPERLAVREVAERFGALLGRDVAFVGEAAPDALLSDPSRALALMGPPRIGADQLIPMIADWLRQGRPLLDKPTHFEVRDGRF